MPSLIQNNRLITLASAVLIALACSGRAQASDDKTPLAAFRSDGCSGFPDGTWSQNQLWLNCCRQHDWEYWQGGTETQRQASDQALEHCVAAVGEPDIAQLMLAGVRVGGSPYLPTDFRWGYGWPYGRGYQPLSKREQHQVEQLTARLDWTPTSPHVKEP